MTTFIATLSVITRPNSGMSEYFCSTYRKQAENVGLKINGVSMNCPANAEYVAVGLFRYVGGGKYEDWTLRLPNYLVPAELVAAIQGDDPTDEEYDVYSDHNHIPTVLPWSMIKDYMDTPKVLHLTINGVDVACEVIHA